MSFAQHHPRRFGTLRYVYPVISRRSGGLSLGVNLSPSGLCNFACVYCQILAEGTESKTDSPLVPVECIETELRQLITSVNDGTLFEQSPFVNVPAEKRLLKDIAFSGDGEPTLSPQFAEVVRLVADVRKELCGESVKIVLITNATTLHLTPVRSALSFMLQNNGEVWAKLDAGTPEFYRTVSRSKVPYQTICSNLINFTQDFPVVVQTCFLALHGEGPTADEIRHYADRLNELGKVSYVQIYTVARITPEYWATPLGSRQLDEIAETVRQLTGLDVRVFP
ncbi:MAG: radical SAM protein [Planctomycetaceae bacterium]|jgi:wyosine [tRNA(Phe)-imidazoG37] synthetase (radical SAM superfamily)|nr:radical SAM protein [Planctomycetaceae bacterium]